MQSNFDLAIIGGGIIGAGIARDAALRGLSVIVLEKGDFAGGASGQNGRMIHGGLKYLETLDIGLVREALRERRILQTIAPHLVRPTELTMPIRKGGRPRVMIGAGLLLFDIINMFRDPRSRIISARKALETCNGLAPEGLVGAAVIKDAWAEFSERLTMENLVGAAQSSAEIRNRTKVTGLALDDAGEKIIVTFARDGAEQQAITASVVVNSTGAWADEVLSATCAENQRMVRGSKGTIMIAEGLKNAPERPVFFEAKSDKRPVLIAPWNGMHLIGTTDHLVEQPVDEVWAEDAEVEYLLSEINQSFPKLNLGRGDIRYLYTGVRPLPFSTKNSVKVSRHHVVKKHSKFSGRLITVVGGKLSTFRKIAEDVLRAADGKFDRPLAPSQTASYPLPGALDASGRAKIKERAQCLKISPKSIEHMLAVYGMRAAGILDLIEGNAELGAVVDAETGATAAEIEFVVANEWARDLTDILVRRTMIGRNKFAGRNAVSPVNKVLRRIGWSAGKIAAGTGNYERFVKKSTGLIKADKSGVCHGTP